MKKFFTVLLIGMTLATSVQVATPRRAEALGAVAFWVGLNGIDDAQNANIPYYNPFLVGSYLLMAGGFIVGISCLSVGLPICALDAEGQKTLPALTEKYLTENGYEAKDVPALLQQDHQLMEVLKHESLAVTKNDNSTTLYEAVQQRLPEVSKDYVALLATRLGVPVVQ